ncbi:MAG: hypothetical protein REI94_15920 [Moraxellaceae bacterium]|nr:hypothetical protein [Moraxellaceae bacterium]
MLCTVLAGLLLQLGACASFIPYDIRAGETTREQVIASSGQPARVWQNADGSETLEYPMQPFGTECYMITIAADGRVRTVEDGLSERSRARVRPGLGKEAVLRMLGSPRKVAYFARMEEEVMDWNVRNPGHQSGLRFNVHFNAAGEVVRTSETIYDLGPERFSR